MRGGTAPTALILVPPPIGSYPAVSVYEAQSGQRLIQINYATGSISRPLLAIQAT